MSTVSVSTSNVAIVAPSDCAGVRVQQPDGGSGALTPFTAYAPDGTTVLSNGQPGDNFQFRPTGLPGAQIFPSGATVGFLKVPSGTYTFNVGVEVIAPYNTGGRTNSLEFQGPQRDPIAQKLATAGAGAQAITIKEGTAVITAATAATGITLAAPAPGTDDGKILTIIAATNAAHVVTVTGGVNGGGAASDVCTFGGTAAGGGCMILEAFNGLWLTRALLGVTPA